MDILSAGSLGFLWCFVSGFLRRFQAAIDGRMQNLGLKKVTPHTQSLLGHLSPKTMQIYTPVAVNAFRRIKNPLDLK